MLYKIFFRPKYFYPNFLLEVYSRQLYTKRVNYHLFNSHALHSIANLQVHTLASYNNHNSINNNDTKQNFLTHRTLNNQLEYVCSKKFLSQDVSNNLSKPPSKPKLKRWFKLGGYGGGLRQRITHTINWLKHGFQAFGVNLRVSMLLAKKRLKGNPLSYREHKLLIRTSSDLFKLIPFSFFIIVPFAELLLPVVLWFFPRMLPSTFLDEKSDKPFLQRKLKAKQELSIFFQEIIQDRTRQILEDSTSEKAKLKAKLLGELQHKLLTRSKEKASLAVESSSKSSNDALNNFLSLEEALTYAKLFRDEFKLENLPTKALVIICNMLGIQPYKLRASMILQLRHHILSIQKDDCQIMWEGVDSLSHDELINACRERAMLFEDVSDKVMREQLKQWLYFSSHKDIAPLFLLWSKTVTMAQVQLNLTSISQQSEKNIPIQFSLDELLPKLDFQNQQNNKVMTLEVSTQDVKNKQDEFQKHIASLKEEAEKLYTELKRSTKIDIKRMLLASLQRRSIQSNLLNETTKPQNLNTSDISENNDSDEIFQKIMNLEKEIDLLRKVNSIQHEQITLVIKSFTNLMETYKINYKAAILNPAEYLKHLMTRLDHTISCFEAGENDISNLLETTPK